MFKYLTLLSVWCFVFLGGAGVVTPFLGWVPLLQWPVSHWLTTGWVAMSAGISLGICWDLLVE